MVYTRLVHGWNIVGTLQEHCWLTLVPWFVTQLVHGWYMAGTWFDTWLIYSWYMVGTWLVHGPF